MLWAWERPRDPMRHTLRALRLGTGSRMPKELPRHAWAARCAPNPARPSSIDLDLRSVTPAAFRLRLLPEQCCHLQLLHGPITVGTIPNENTAFTTCVDPISPPIF